MRELRDVRVDPEQKLVYVQGGAKWKDVNEETQKHGLACAGPCFDTIGVAGYSLGWGFGYLTGKKLEKLRIFIITITLYFKVFYL
jgi:FAD/FMN-containing dehydrogenase